MESNIKFTWYMTEDDWSELKSTYDNKDYVNEREEWGTFICGKMAFTIYNSYDKDLKGWNSHINFLVYGLNGSNSYLDKHNSVPINQVANDFIVPIKQKSFESFKKSLEKHITKEIKRNPTWLAWSNASFGWKQYFEDHKTWETITDLSYREVQFSSYFQMYKSEVNNTLESSDDHKIKLYCEGMMKCLNDLSNIMEQIKTV